MAGVEGEFLTTAELAGLLRTTEATVRNKRERGEGPPAVGYGRAVRYRRAAVEVWIAEKEAADLARAEEARAKYERARTPAPPVPPEVVRGLPVRQVIRRPDR